MTRRTKRMLALMLAGSMTLGMGVTAFAADTTPVTSGGGTGDGTFEGHVDQSKLEVTLPTDNNTTTFKYTIDPEGLIAATQAAKYPGTTYNSATGVYFQTSDKNYTDKSAKLKVTNVGSVDADVTVEVSVDDDALKTDGTGIADMKAKESFTADGAEELYMGLVINNDTGTPVTAAGDDGKATKTVGLKGRPDNFEVQYKDGAYTYAAKDGVADTAWNSFEFGLEGACNPKGDYSADNFAVPTVTVTWSYAERADDSTADMLGENATADAKPSIAATPFNYDRTTTLDIPVNLGAGTLKATAVSKVEASNDGTTVTSDFTANCTIASDKITIASGKLGGAAVGDTRYLLVTFDEGTVAKVTLNITK